MGATLRNHRESPRGLTRVHADVHRTVDAGARRLAKPGPGATRPRRAARGRVDAHTVTSLVKTPRAIHPRRDGVDRGGAWPAAREPDPRIATARRAAMDRATGRADRRSRLLSTPRSPPGPAPESVLAARLWPRERRRSHRRSGAAALPRSPRGGGPHAAPRPVPLSACNSGVTRHGIGLMVCAGSRRLPAGQASPAHIPTPHV